MKKPSVSLVVLPISALTIALNIIFGQTVLYKKDAVLSSVEGELRVLRGSSRIGRLDPTEEITKFKKRLPVHSELTSALEEVFDAARKNGLKLSVGDYNPETIKDMNISRYTVSFPAEGSYARIKRFIYDLESSQKHFTVEEISLASSKGIEGVIGLKITLSAYFI